jgi:hypothetical protein
MSRHHRAQKWTTHSPKLRKLIDAQLPLPCIACHRAVNPGDTYHVGHRQDAALGGRPTSANTGPVHPGCNLRSGGKLGARITNSKRQAGKDIRPW